MKRLVAGTLAGAFVMSALQADASSSRHRVDVQPGDRVVLVIEGDHQEDGTLCWDYRSAGKNRTRAVIAIAPDPDSCPVHRGYGNQR